MCFINRFDFLASRKILIGMASVAALLTVFVFTNDLHRQVFFFNNADPATWTNQYSNGWGYYLSVFWSFSLSITGLPLLIHKKRTRRQRRQMLYAGGFFAALLIYQMLYVLGIKYIIDLDIPTTVAIFILLFNFAAQRERFMGASLLTLPLFHNSPYAIAIADGAGHTVFRNAVMETFAQNEGDVLIERYSSMTEMSAVNRVYRPHRYNLGNGTALVLEDITDIRFLEHSLEQAKNKQHAVREILMRRVSQAPSLGVKLERERYLRQAEGLFNEKLEQARQAMRLVAAEGMGLRRARLLLCLCQRRLRLLLRSLEASSHIPVELIEAYAASVMEDSCRLGLDGVFSAACCNDCPYSIVEKLLETIDQIMLGAFDVPGSSLICRLKSDDSGISFSALLSTEGQSAVLHTLLPDRLTVELSDLGCCVRQEWEEDGLLIRLHFPYSEVTR